MTLQEELDNLQEAINNLKKELLTIFFNFGRRKKK